VLKLLLFFQLLFVVNQLHFPWETGIPALAPTNLIFLLVLLFMRGKPEMLDTGEPILKKRLLWFYGALVLAFLWAQVLGPRDFVDDLTYLKTALFFPLYYFLYLNCRQDEKTTRQLIIWIMVIAAVAGLEAIREGIDYGFGKYNPLRRASGPFGVDWHHANRAGVFYGIFTPMFVALALFLKGQKLWRIAAIGGIVLLAGGALFTYSRQAYILVLLSLAILLIRKSVVIAVVLGIALASSVSYLPDSVIQRAEETRQEGKGGGEEVDVSTASRWEIWGGAMDMLKENPLGVGLNRFKANIGNYCKHKGMDAHNFYVLTLAETGPHGLITYLLFLAALFRLARFLRMNAPKDDPEAVALTIGFTMSTVCMVLGQIYGSPTFEGSVMGCYWALCGLMERYIKFKMQKAGAAAEKAPEPTMLDRFPLSAYLKKR
jgi:O-antigen ligase